MIFFIAQKYTQTHYFGNSYFHIIRTSHSTPWKNIDVRFDWMVFGSWRFILFIVREEWVGRMEYIQGVFEVYYSNCNGD